MESGMSNEPKMITVLITDNYDPAKVLGSVTIREDAVNDENLVLGIAGIVKSRGKDRDVTKFKLCGFGLFHVLNHSAVVDEIARRDTSRD